MMDGVRKEGVKMSEKVNEGERNRDWDTPFKTHSTHINFLVIYYYIFSDLWTTMNQTQDKTI